MSHITSYILLSRGRLVGKETLRVFAGKCTEGD